MRELLRRVGRLEAARWQRKGHAFVIEMDGDPAKASSLRGTITRHPEESAPAFERRAIAALMPESGSALITFA